MRPDVEAAYFAVLRAREDLTNLQRYDEHLRDELRRLARFLAETRAAAEDAPRGLRRRLRHTDDPLDEAIRARRDAAADELSRMDDRIEAAQAYVQECEAEHQRLRARSS